MSLAEKIENALENLVTLEIMTAVGKVEFQADGNGDPQPAGLDRGADPKVILTKVNMLQGDIENIIDPAFITGDYQGLREFHANAQKQGSRIVSNNIAALKELYNLAKSWDK